MREKRKKPSSAESPAKKRFCALVAAVEYAQTSADFDLAMQICTPIQTRAKSIGKQVIVQQQAEKFLSLINEETAKLNQQIRVKAHQLKCKQRRIDEYFRQVKAIDR